MDTDAQAGLPDADPATAAFRSLGEKVDLLEAAVTGLAAKREAAPDYSETLGEMAVRLGEMSQSLAILADKPAMRLTPHALAERIEAAAQAARRTDHDQLTEARQDLYRAAQDMRGLIGSARTAAEQSRRLWQAMAGSIVAGILLWSFLPGTIARSAPDSWHWPERIAARMLRLDHWSAGERLLATAEPERWQLVVLADRILQENHEAIAACRHKAQQNATPARCTVTISRDER